MASSIDCTSGKLSRVADLSTPTSEDVRADARDAGTGRSRIGDEAKKWVGYRSRSGSRGGRCARRHNCHGATIARSHFPFGQRRALSDSMSKRPAKPTASPSPASSTSPVRRIRPSKRPVYLKLHFAPGECAHGCGGPAGHCQRKAELTGREAQAGAATLLSSLASSGQHF
jgi:hypothetical protein